MWCPAYPPHQGLATLGGPTLQPSVSDAVVAADAILGLVEYSVGGASAGPKVPSNLWYSGP